MDHTCRASDGPYNSYKSLYIPIKKFLPIKSYILTIFGPNSYKSPIFSLLHNNESAQSHVVIILVENLKMQWEFYRIPYQKKFARLRRRDVPLIYTYTPPLAIKILHLPTWLLHKISYIFPIFSWKRPYKSLYFQADYPYISPIFLPNPAGSPGFSHGS